VAITNALAGIAVKDFTLAVAWYEQLLNRPADSRPMEGLAEWQFAMGGGSIQVFHDKDRAGSSSVTLVVTSCDDQLVELEAKGVPVGLTNTSDKFKIAIVTDPDGNQIVFAEALGDRK
jgi:hypothetical protein